MQEMDYLANKSDYSKPKILYFVLSSKLTKMYFSDKFIHINILA